MILYYKRGKDVFHYESRLTDHRTHWHGCQLTHKRIHCGRNLGTLQQL